MCLTSLQTVKSFLYTGLQFCLKMSYAVVEFDDETVDVIPSSWLLNDTTCYWPPYRALRLTSAIKKREEPQETWSKCVLRVIRYYGLYTITVNLNIKFLDLIWCLHVKLARQIISADVAVPLMSIFRKSCLWAVTHYNIGSSVFGKDKHSS